MWPKLSSITEAPASGGRARGLILLYHRVVELKPDPWSLSVSPRHFAEQLDTLCRLTKPLSLAELAIGIEKGRLPDRATVVTFDDGYADNLYQAVPQLERFRCPATFFITGAPPASDREYWWDELHRLFTRNDELPEYLEFTCGRQKHCWKLGRAAQYTEQERWGDNGTRAWAAKQDSRYHIYYAVWKVLRALPHSERLDILETLHGWAGADRECRPEYRPMTLQEICELSDNNLISVGGHTATHMLLPAQPPSIQRKEMLRNKCCLQELIGREIDAISYPYGEYNSETVAMARETGFKTGCSSDSGIVSAKGDLLRLPRIPVQDWNGDEFRDLLEGWLRSSS